MKNNLNLKNQKNLPQHLGIILDGNRRWAKKHNLSKLEGHRQGLNNIKKVSKLVFEKGIKILSIYAFSTENWKREETEVKYLMKLFKIFLKKEAKTIIKQGVRVNFWGRLSDFSSEIQSEIKKVQKESKGGSKGILNVCLSYGGRDELVRAFKKIMEQGIGIEDINQELISKNLDSAGLADPDMIIRTSGEQRLSGFLTWQSVYSELYFTEKYWPEFGESDLDLALNEYALRQRRFGKA